MLVGGVAGTWLGGWIGDRVGPARPGAYALIPAVCFLITAPCLRARPVRAQSVGRLASVRDRADDRPRLARPGHLCGPAHRPARIRATASASFLFINNLIGIAFGIYFLGWLSDRMKAAHGTDSLQYSILYGLGFYLLSAAIYFVASRRLARDWVG